MERIETQSQPLTCRKQHKAKCQYNEANSGQTNLANKACDLGHHNRSPNQTEASRSEDNRHIFRRTMQNFLHKSPGQFSNQQHKNTNQRELDHRKEKQTISSYNTPS